MRIRTRSFIILISQLLHQSVAIVVPIVLVRLVSKDMLGSYRQVFVVYGVIAGLLSYQLGNSLFYFLPKVGPERRRELLAQTLVGTLIRAGLIGAVLMLAAGPVAAAFQNPRLTVPLRVVGLYAFGDSLAQLIPAFMITLDRPARAGVYGVLIALARMAAIIGVFLIGGGLASVIGVVASVQMAIAVVGCMDMVRLSPLGTWRLEPELMRQQWEYSWPLWPTAVVGTLSVYLDKLIISGFFDPAAYAVYSCGAIELPVIALVTTSISSAIMPRLVVLASEGHILQALRIWQEAVRKCSFVILPCFVFFLLVSEDFMVLLYGADYRLAAWPFRIYLLMLPLRIAVYATMFRALGLTKFIAVGAFLTLMVNAIGSWTVTYFGRGTLVGFIGPSIGVALAAFVAVVYYLWRLCQVLKLPVSQIMRWRELARVLLLSAIAGLSIVALPVSGLSLPVRLSLEAAVFAGVLLALLLGTNTFNADERQLLVVPLHKARSLWLKHRGSLAGNKSTAE